MRRGLGGERGGGACMGRGVGGTVTEVAADHYTIKNEAGETFTVHYSANTRVVKQPAQRPGPDAMRTPPEAIKPAEIHAGRRHHGRRGNGSGSKIGGRAMVVKIDPQRAREMREMQANFGKTWLAGRVTAVNDTKVTLRVRWTMPSIPLSPMKTPRSAAVANR